MSQHPCWGKTYPRALGVTRGGCHTLPPGQCCYIDNVTAPLDVPMDFPVFQYDRIDAHRPPSTNNPEDMFNCALWVQIRSPAGVNASVIWKWFGETPGGSFRWQWMMQVHFPGWNVKYHRWKGIIMDVYDCHGSIILTHDPVPGETGIAVQPQVLLRPALYGELPADYCRPRL